MSYFYAYFHGDFKESSSFSSTSEHALDSQSNEGKRWKEVWISLEPFLEDGIEPCVFAKLVKFSYSGAFDDLSGDVEHNTGLSVESSDDSLDSLDPPLESFDESCIKVVDIEHEVHEKMGLLVAANRFGVSNSIRESLEKSLVSCVKDNRENIQILKDFAVSYNFPILEKNCDQLLSNFKN